LRLHFSTPGTQHSKEIFALLDRSRVQPLSIVRVELKSSARESAGNFQRAAAVAAQIKRAWFESSSSYEFTVAGDAEKFVKELTTYYAANASLEAKISTPDKLYYLDEP